MHTQSLSHVQLFATPWTAALPGSSVHGIFQARILEWVAISSSRESSQLRDPTHICCISCIGRQVLYHCTTWEALGCMVLMCILQIRKLRWEGERTGLASSHSESNRQGRDVSLWLTHSEAHVENTWRGCRFMSRIRKTFSCWTNVYARQQSWGIFM